MQFNINTKHKYILQENEIEAEQQMTKWCKIHYIHSQIWLFRWKQYFNAKRVFEEGYGGTTIV